MNVAVATKISEQQKTVLEYLAYRQHTKPADLIRRAILATYDLTSPELTEEATSFFDSSVRQIAQMDDISITDAAPSQNR